VFTACYPIRAYTHDERNEDDRRREGHEDGTE